MTVAIGGALGADWIDEIAPPGTDLYHPDSAWRHPALADTARRRPFADRAAG